MFGFGPATLVYVATGATDMRKGFNGLYGLVRDDMACDPESGHVFLFSNARRNRVKLLVYDRSGLWVCTKKLDRGRFRWPRADTSVAKIVLSHEELAVVRSFRCHLTRLVKCIGFHPPTIARHHRHAAVNPGAPPNFFTVSRN